MLDTMLENVIVTRPLECTFALLLATGRLESASPIIWNTPRSGNQISDACRKTKPMGYWDSDQLKRSSVQVNSKTNVASYDEVCGSIWSTKKISMPRKTLESPPSVEAGIR